MHVFLKCTSTKLTKIVRKYSSIIKWRITEGFYLLFRLKSDRLLDTETYSEDSPVDEKDIPALDPFRNKVRLITVSDGNQTFIFDMKAYSQPGALIELIAGRTVIGHNLAFDFKSLLTDYGERILPDKCFDTMHAAELLYYSESIGHPRKGEMGLAGLCGRYLDETLNKEFQASDWSGDLIPEQLEYAATDVTFLKPLEAELSSALEDAGFSDEVVETEMAFVLERARIELAGIHVDVPGIEAAINEINPRVEKMNAEYLQEGLNPRSPKMLEYLQGLGFDVESTQKDALVELVGDQEIDRLLKLRELEHQIRYLESTIDHQHEGKVYPDFRQIGGPTGRMSCHGLNLQAIPTALAGLYSAPPPGYAILTADLPAIEMRIAAVVADEDVLKDCFQSGQDPHTLMASRITGKPVSEVGKNSPERKKAKAANFGFLFGMGAATFQRYAMAQGIEFSIDEAEDFRREFFNLYPGIKSWHGMTGESLRESEEEVYLKEAKKMVKTIIRETISGRVMRAAGYCSALNYAVQGTGADMIKKSAVLVGQKFRKIGLRARIIHMVHDDLRVLCPIEEVQTVSALLTSIMGKVVDGMLKEFRTVPEIKIIKSSAG